MRKRTNFDESAIQNNATYYQYFNRLLEMALSSFKWDVPLSVNARFLETTLFRRGAAVFFKDDVLGYLCLPVILGGKLDVYNEPIERRAFANNGYQATLYPDNSVIIYNNMTRNPSYLDTIEFSKRLYNIDRTIDVNVNAQKTPILIRCPEPQRLTMLNVYKDYDGNSPVIFGDKGLDASGFSVLSTGAPYVADRLYQLKTQIWNEYLTFRGISNLTIQKKERVVSDEVLRSQGGTLANRNSFILERQRACERIQEIFGVSVWCEFNESTSNYGDMQTNSDYEGVEYYE